MIQKHIKLISLSVLLLILSACGTQASNPVSTATSTAGSDTVNIPTTPQPTDVAESASGMSAAEDVAAAVASRTPVPTPTPSIVDHEVNRLTTSLGIAGKTLFGLTADDWVNLAISIVIVIAGYFLGFRLLVWLLKWFARRTSRDYNESILKELSPDLKLLLLVIFSSFAILRLDFLSDEVRTIADDFFFILELVLIAIIAIRLMNYALNHYITATGKKYDPEKLDPLIKTIQRVGDFSVLIIVGSIGVSHFGIGGSALAVGFIILGVILYMGARGIVADFVAGFIILVDQPIRVGDAVLIEKLDRWGVVLDIGARTTRIRIEDNREVIVPNSQINESHVVNYSFPDPRYRSSTDIGVGYGSDPEQMVRVIKETVQGVKGVLKEKPVDVLFLSFGETSRQVQVRWWIDNYENDSSIKNEVNTALEAALNEAGIDLPFDTYNLIVKSAENDVEDHEKKGKVKKSNKNKKTN